MTKRAVLYARLSNASEESVSIERQLEACRNYCAAQGWEIAGEHVDYAVSATAKAPNKRPGWQELMDHPRGTFDVVLTWKLDRLIRRTADLMDAVRDLEARGATLATVADHIDMSTATGRFTTTLLSAVAEVEAENIRARVKDARRKLIKDGRVPGGAAPFGYCNGPNPGGPGKVLAKDPATIGFVTEAVTRVLRGDSINSVAAYLDEVAPREGLRKNSAAHWTITVTKRMLQNPALAGMTPHNPGNTSKKRGSEVLRDETGMPIVRRELAILSTDEYRALTDRLAVTEPYTTPTPSYLAGLVWCGHCNRPMYRNAKTVNGKKVRVFQCQGKEGCGQQVSHLETIVETMFLKQYGDLRTIRIHSTTEDRDLSEVNAQIDDALARMREEDADVVALAERLKALRAVKARTPEPEYIQELTDTTGAEEWAADPRAALLNHCTRVQLTKGKTGRKFDMSRLSFIGIRNFDDPTRLTVSRPKIIKLDQADLA